MTEDGARLRSVLTRRAAVLRRLETEPGRKPALVSALPISRSTVDRAIDDLLEVGCIERVEGRYEPTTTGRLALAEHDRYVDRTDTIDGAAELLDQLPAEVAPDARFLAGVEATIAEPHAPEQAIAGTDALLCEATALRGIAPVLRRSYVETVGNALDRKPFSAEIVAGPKVIETLTESGVDAHFDHRNLSLYRAESALPYALWVMERPDGDHAGITVHDGGGIAGVLQNDSEPALAWATETYRRYREDARTVSPPYK